MTGKRLRTLAAAIVIGLASAGAVAAPAQATTAGATNCDGRLEAFRVNTSGSVDHWWEFTPGGQRSGWTSLGGQVIYDEIAAFTNGDCKIEIFVVGTNYHMYTNWQIGANGAGGWHGWVDIGGYLGTGPTEYHVFIGGQELWGVRSLTKTTMLKTCARHTQPYGSPWTAWSAIYCA